MKKLLSSSLVLLVIISLALAFTACGNGVSGPSASVAPTASLTYKDTMQPFDQLVSAERIIIIQNTLNYSREGFYTAESKPQTQSITYAGKAVDAYPLTYAIDFLHLALEGNLTIYNNDGTTASLPAEAFKGCYVILDFMSSDSIVLYNPTTGDSFADFLFAVTSNGEAFYSVVSDTTYNAKDLIQSVGWDGGATYRYVATDKFYIPVGPAENSTGEVRGALSGAVNGSFPDLALASGKINDVIYIEKMAE